MTIQCREYVKNLLNYLFSLFTIMGNIIYAYNDFCDIFTRVINTKIVNIGPNI